MLTTSKSFGLGWLPDPPDFRDYTVKRAEVEVKTRKLGQDDSVQGMLGRIGVLKGKKKRPSSQNLSLLCSPIEDQESLGSCTAHAAVGLLEYYENRASGKFVDASRLFLYKVTRNLLGWRGDTGAYLRTTMGALTLIGAPPERYWPYIIDRFEEEPPAFCYALAHNYQTVQYFRLDPPGTSETELLEQIKTFLAVGLPLIFGFRVYSCLDFAEGGQIPFPTWGDDVQGGHAVLAVGYDDNLKIKHPGKKGIETTGAILFRNSWGESWGNKGYGWLPYDYVLNGLAVDWWSMLKTDWVDNGNFEL